MSGNVLPTTQALQKYHSALSLKNGKSTVPRSSTLLPNVSRVTAFHLGQPPDLLRPYSLISVCCPHSFKYARNYQISDSTCRGLSLPTVRPCSCCGGDSCSGPEVCLVWTLREEAPLGLRSSFLSLSMTVKGSGEVAQGLCTQCRAVPVACGRGSLAGRWFPASSVVPGISLSRSHPHPFLACLLSMPSAFTLLSLLEGMLQWSLQHWPAQVSHGPPPPPVPLQVSGHCPVMSPLSSLPPLAAKG